jgi:hypothetical protein
MRADVVSGAVFPDYELSDHWARGDKTGFHPYGKTQAQVFAEQVEP